MNKIVKVNATSFLTRAGKLVKRKSYRRILHSKINYNQAKKRVISLRNTLNELKKLTLKDSQQLEYATALNKTRSETKSIVKGIIENINGKPAKVVYIPNQIKHERYWLLHSHPDKTPLSLPDITNGKKGATIFAISTDGSIYRSTKKASTEEISQAYETAKLKIKGSGIVKEIIDNYKFNNPTIKEESIREELMISIQNKLLKHLHNKKLIHYRAKLTPYSKIITTRFKDLDKLELKRYLRNIINFKSYNKINSF